MTQIRLPDEINQLADQIRIGERFRTCDICHRLKPRRNGIQLVQVGVYLARRDDLRLITKGVWEKVEE
jgi:hypothetical protein